MVGRQMVGCQGLLDGWLSGFTRWGRWLAIRWLHGLLDGSLSGFAVGCQTAGCQGLLDGSTFTIGGHVNFDLMH